MKKWLITKLGGYPDIESLLKVVDNHEDKVKILNHAVKHLFNTIGADDILKEQGLDWIYQGKVLPSNVRQQLTAEAQIFVKTRLWNVMRDDIKYLINKMMYEKSKSEVDLIVGKMGLFILDCFKTRLNSLEKQSGRFNIKTAKADAH